MLSFFCVFLAILCRIDIMKVVCYTTKVGDSMNIEKEAKAIIESIEVFFVMNKKVANREEKKKILEEEICKKLRKNPELCLYQGIDKFNIGMIAAIYGMENVVIENLKNPEAALQKDMFGNNIGLIAAQQDLGYGVLCEALKNKEASLQKNDFNNDIYDYVRVKTQKEFEEMKKSKLEDREK